MSAVTKPQVGRATQLRGRWWLLPALVLGGCSHGQALPLTVSAPPPEMRILEIQAYATPQGVSVTGSVHRGWRTRFPSVRISAPGCDPVSVGIAGYDMHNWGKGRFAAHLNCRSGATATPVEVSFVVADH